MKNRDSCQPLEELVPEASSVEKIESPPSSGDQNLGKIADQQEEGEEESDKIAHEVIDHKHEQAEGAADSAGDIEVQELLAMDDDALKELMVGYFRQLFQRNSYDDESSVSYCRDPQQLTEAYRRIALYRIRGYELSEGIASGEQDCSPSVLDEMKYFEHYEESLEWYFDTGRVEEGYDDYQCLVLRDDGYDNWYRCQGIYSTYEEDLAYVQYREKIANATKWIEDYLETDSSTVWEKVKIVAKIQGAKIAIDSPDCDHFCVLTCITEHIWTVRVDYSAYKDLDFVYFEIWKRVAKQKMNFTDALKEVHKLDMCGLRRKRISFELENAQGRLRPMKYKYDTHVACIDEMVSEDEARGLIREIVHDRIRREKTYLDYIRKKIAIAEDIGLLTKRKIQDTAQLSEEDNSEANLTMANQAE